jgi:DNA-binding CsgD family transcriptional regulator
MVDVRRFLAGVSPVQGKTVVARFDGGRLSSEGGSLARREVERRLGLSDRLASCGPARAGEGRNFDALPEEPPVLLTPREIKVLGALGNGITNKEVARLLGISPHTVKFHIESLFRKLGVESNAPAPNFGLSGLGFALGAEAGFAVDPDVQQEAEAEHDGEHRSAAVGDQRQRHADHWD